MKLRNKNTGKIAEVTKLSENKIVCVCIRYVNELVPELLTYIKKDFEEEWEDYNPDEPLIKDEKIRKAVRAWAEANGTGECVCKEEIHCITFETERGMFISFDNADPIPPEGNFSIAELCGEEDDE